MLTFRLREQLTDQNWGKYGPHFVFYGLRDQFELEEWAHKLGDRAECFYEPDRDFELTAIAYIGPRMEDFDSLRLL